MTCEEQHRTMYTIFILIVMFFINCGIIYFYFSTLKESTWYNKENQAQVVLNTLRKESN